MDPLHAQRQRVTRTIRNDRARGIRLWQVSVLPALPGYPAGLGITANPERFCPQLEVELAGLDWPDDVRGAGVGILLLPVDPDKLVETQKTAILNLPRDHIFAEEQLRARGVAIQDLPNHLSDEFLALVTRFRKLHEGSEEQ